MMGADIDQLQDELAKVEQGIVAQEELRGIVPDVQIEAVLASLRERQDVLVAQLAGSGVIVQGSDNVVVGTQGVSVADSEIGGSVVTGSVSAGGHVAMRDLVVVTEQVAADFWPREQPDLQRATTRYLQHLVNRYRYLDFKGMGVLDRVALRLPLVEMYVPLKARIEMPEGETWARELQVAGRTLSEEEAAGVGHRLSEPQPLLDLLQKQDGLIILGDPGAGKTTFLKVLALRLALGEGEAMGVGNRLPVLLPLSAYANALSQEDVPLHRFMARYYEGLGVDEPLAAMLKEALTQGRAILLLDGLDEVKDAAQRLLVVRRVMDFYAYQQQDGNKFVLTSRIVGYREVRATATAMVECTLVDFDESEISAFVEKWTGALERAARGETDVAVVEAVRERDELLASVRHNPGVRRLAANPLLLTILALMKRQGVVLPERRVELYDKYVETLLKHWNLARGLGRPLSRDLDVVETMRVLAPLALWMHKTSPGVGLVKREDMRRKLVQIYVDRQIDAPEQAAQRLLTDARDIAGLLVERGPGEFGFIHLTFQEYLAAVAVAQQGQGDVKAVADVLAPHVGVDNWHEVILLTIGYMGIRQQLDAQAGRVLLRLMEMEPGAPGEAVVLAGDAVVDTWPGGVTRACRDQVVARLLQTMQDDAQVNPVRRAQAARVLARLGDPRPEVTTVDGMRFCLVPAGSFWMGDDKDRHENVALDYDYWLGNFTVTMAQFRAFVEDGGYKQDAFWVEAAAAGFWENGRFKGRYDDEWREEPVHLGQRFGGANQPIVGVTWYECVAFCRWLNMRWQTAGLLPKGWQVTLPSEAEWEKGARGGLVVPQTPVVLGMDGEMETAVYHAINNPRPKRPFPWGGEQATANWANWKETKIETTSGVGCFPRNVSPYGCAEMSGNVWEWTRSQYRPYPYDPRDGREGLKAGANVSRALRGGAYYSSKPPSLGCAIRGWNLPFNGVDDRGFRVCVSPFSLFSDL